MAKNDELTNLEAALGELPIFPLSQVVLFPRALLPLHIFEQRYRAMLKDALATHRAIAMALVVPGELDARGQPKIAPVAGAGVILEHQELPDGRSNIVLHGVARVRLEELPFVPPYRRAKATILHDAEKPSCPWADRTALLAQATSFAQEVQKRDPSFNLRLPASLETGAIADLCAHHLVIDAAVRQKILEELDVTERVRLVTTELATQQAALRTSERTTLH